jgi:hypothetical protein
MNMSLKSALCRVAAAALSASVAIGSLAADELRLRIERDRVVVEGATPGEEVVVMTVDRFARNYVWRTKTETTRARCEPDGSASVSLATPDLVHRVVVAVDVTTTNFAVAAIGGELRVSQNGTPARGTPALHVVRGDAARTAIRPWRPAGEPRSERETRWRGTAEADGEIEPDLLLSVDAATSTLYVDRRSR